MAYKLEVASFKHVKQQQFPSGVDGFGYDPIFEVNGKTLAEMTPEEKSEISHRKNASIKMVKLLNEK